MNAKDEALKMAIDDLELCNGAKTVEDIIIYTHEAINACKEALEQQEQEPVALGDFDRMTKKECVDYIEYLRHEIDLLTPKQLSDDEIWEIAKQSYGHAIGLVNHLGFARAIEAKIRGE